ncbi:MAG: hypothetical protein EP312_06675 [Gammaproteobacteria bacterium]|nr:MAG: hypothetical protein EP312_06675 [Gammaproteobacteria bacterium]
MHWMRNPPLALLMGLAAFFIGWLYWPVHDFGFVWDDTHLFVDTDFYRNRQAWHNALFEPFWLTNEYYRPLAVLTFVAEGRWHDMHPGWMHVAGLLIHIINALLTGLLTLSLIRQTHPGSRWPAVVATLLYGLHYGLLEAPTWISCRFDLLYTAFLLATLWLDIRIRHHWMAGISMGLAFFLAACSKETAAVLAIILPCWHLACWQLSGKQDSAFDYLKTRWPRYACLFVAGLAYLVLRTTILPAVMPTSAPDSIQSPWLPWWTLDIYLRLSLIPFGYLAPIYPEPLTQWAIIPAVLLLALILAAARLPLQAPQRNAAFILLFAYFVALFPALNILPFNILGTFAAARYLTFPLAILVMMLTLVACHSRYLRSMTVAALAWLVLSIANIAITLPLWASPLNLWSWASEKHPQSSYAAINRIAESIKEQSFSESMAMIEDALTRFPDETGLILHKAFIELQRQQPEVALETMKVLEGRVSRANLVLIALNYKTIALLQMCENPDNIIGYVNQALEINPSSASDWLLLAVVYQLNRQEDAAEEAYQEALQRTIKNHQHDIETGWQNWKAHISNKCLQSPQESSTTH